MMHKAWSSIEEVPYWFFKVIVKLRGHTAKKIVYFDPNWVFPDCNSSLNSQSAIGRLICPQGRVSLLNKWNPIQFTIGYEWTKLESSVEKMPYCFSMLSVKLLGNMAKKTLTFTQIERFRIVAPVWIHLGYEITHKARISIEEVPCCFSRSSVKLRVPTAQKIVDFDQNWAFLDCNSSLNSPMATKWCTELEVAH